MEAPQPPVPPAWETLFTPAEEPLTEEHTLLYHVAEFKLTGCSLEELSSIEDLTWESLYTFLNVRDENGCRLIVSVAPGVFLSAGGDASFYLSSSGCERAYGMSQLETEQNIWVWTADGYEQEVTSSCDFLLGLLAEADQPDARVMAAPESNDVSTCPFSGSAIENYLTKSNDNLGSLILGKCIFNECHFQGFANAPVRDELSIVLVECVVATSADTLFLNCLQKGRGPNVLRNCVIDPIVLGLALTTSNRVKILWIGKLELHEGSFCAILRAVAENKSLEVFDAHGACISDYNWHVLCKSLRPHPTLRYLGFDLTRQLHGVSNPQMPLERIERRMNDVLAMLHVNSVLENVELAEDDSGAPPLPQNWLDKIETRLEMNKNAFEAQCHSLGPVTPDLRPKLFGRALHMARLHPTLLWTFLSEHLDTVAEAADERIVSKLDEAARKKRKQADRHDAQKRAKRS